MDYEVLGSSQIVQKTNRKCYTLQDPFLATVLEFIRRCLDQLAHGLHLVIVHTLENSRGGDKKKFFMGEHYKFISDPRTHPSGFDVMYLLKNIKYHRSLYSNILDKKVGAIVRIVDFLLKLRNRLAHESYLSISKSEEQSSSKKYQTTKKCLDDSIKLLDWIVCAEFYIPIKIEVTFIKTNLENMRDVLEQLVRTRQLMKESEASAYNPEEARGLLEWMLDKVNKEEADNTAESFESRPIIHLVNMVLAPRIIWTQDE